MNIHQKMLSMLLVVGLFLIGFAGNADAAGYPNFQSKCIIRGNHECSFDNLQQPVIPVKFTNLSREKCPIEVDNSQEPLDDFYIAGEQSLEKNYPSYPSYPSYRGYEGWSLNFVAGDYDCRVLVEITGDVVRSGEPTEYGYPHWNEPTWGDLDRGYDESSKSASTMGKLLKDTDIPGGDIKKLNTNSAEDCRTACQESQDCRAMTWNVNSHACYLKKYISRKANNPDGVSAIKE